MNILVNPCPPNSSPYIVQPGDTLNSIAKSFGITLQMLINYNPDLRLRSLMTGMSLCLPPVPVRPACPNGIYYTIKRDDSFYKIAQKYGVPLNRLMKANPLSDPYNLQIGQEICIPTKNTNCPFGTVYTIEKGDTLSQILAMYNISVNQLKASNSDFDPSNIVLNTKLCIPPAIPEDGKCSDERIYIVKTGDNIAIIAESYTVTASDLLINNPELRPSDFEIEGIRICIPKESVSV